MTATFIVMTIVSVLVLAYILLSQKDGKKAQQSKNIYKTKKSFFPEPPSSLPKKTSVSETTYSQHDDASFLTDEDLDTMSDVYADQKRFLKTGIESIFSGSDTMPAERLIPLRQKNIGKETTEIVLEQIAALNNFRTEHIRMQKMINDPSFGMPAFSKIVMSDPMLTAKILRMANSSYFGMQQKIDSISHALMILGLQNVKNIIYREGTRRLFQARSPQQESIVTSLWKHSSITSVCASFLNDLFEGLNLGTLFTLGIIHDIGKLMILELPRAKEQEESFWHRYPEDISIWEEDQLLGVNHEIIGGLALEHWNFSDLMIKIIQMHHAPAYMDADKTGLSDEQLKYVVALFIADQIAKLFTDRSDEVIRTYPLLKSYHYLIDKNKLMKKVSDMNLLGQIREAEAVAVAEQREMAMSQERSGRVVRVVDMGSQGAAGKTPTNATTIIKSAMPIDTIGRYEIVRELGRGAMGVVYLALDPLINREVAIKTLRYQDADAKEMAESRTRFFSEAKAIGKLSHPNIVNVYDVGEHKGMAYIAMEYLDGTDLIPYCEKGKLLPLLDVIRIVSSAAVALDYAHKNSIVHRDVKPGNIRILKNGDIKVIDFGIARVMEPSKTNTGIIVGSPSYMSPEQINGQPLDGRSDLFSLGVIFYELLSGEKPFTGDNFTTLLLQITSSTPIPVRRHVPDIPDKCEAILEKALSKDKEKRYQSGREFADDLLRITESMTVEFPAANPVQ